MSTLAQESRGRRSLSKKLALSLATMFAAVIVCELGHRAALALQGTPYSADQTKQRLANMLDPIQAFVPEVGEPETAPQNRPTLPILNPYTGAETRHDSGGVLRYFRERTSSDEYTVVIVGGSVALWFTAMCGKRLSEIIAGDPHLAGRKVKVLNYAHAAYKQPQQLNRIAYLLAFGYKPDAIIDIDGFNEVALAYENAQGGTNPLYPSAPVWAGAVMDFGTKNNRQLEVVSRMIRLRDEAKEVIDRALALYLYDSSILGHWTIGRLEAINARRNELQTELVRADPSMDPRLFRQLNGPDYPAADRDRLELCVNGWLECSLSIDALCRCRGIRYLHVLQPTLEDEGAKQKSVAEAKLRAPSPDWTEGAKVGYPLLREASKQLVERGVAFVDGSRAFAGIEETLYTDTCHFNEAGNRLLVEIVGAEFCRQLLDAR